MNIDKYIKAIERLLKNYENNHTSATNTYTAICGVLTVATLDNDIMNDDFHMLLDKRSEFFREHADHINLGL